MMEGIRWSRQNPALNDTIRKCVLDQLEPIDVRIGGAVSILASIWSYANNCAGIDALYIDSDHLFTTINHVKELPKLNDGVQLNDHLWVRIEFTNWDEGKVRGYTLFVNGLSPRQELLNEAIGSEPCDGATIGSLPECIATPLLMRRVRGRNTSTINLQTPRTAWMTDLRVTADDVIAITRRDKWEYQPQGEKLCKELIHLLSRDESIKVLESKM